MFKTAPEPGLNGRSIAYPRGRVIGGSSAINGMIYMRGQAADYDGWRQLGLAGWGWDDVLPYFIRQEDHHGGACDALHGAGGEWRVERPRISWPILDAVREAGAEIGIPKIDDFNRGDNEGSAYFEVNQRRGRRWSAARGFLKPIAQAAEPAAGDGRACRAHSVRGAPRGRPAISAEDGQSREARASGEIDSGGRRDRLAATPGAFRRRAAGASRRRSARRSCHALPGVGENLQDHLQLRTIFRIEGARTLNVDSQSPFKRAMMGLDYALRRRGPMTMAPSQLGMFARSSPDYATANVEFHVQPLSLDRFGEPLHAFPGDHDQRLQPAAGEPRLEPCRRARDPRAAPVIQPNYLSTVDDRRVAVEFDPPCAPSRRRAGARALRAAGALPGRQAAGSEDELAQAAGDIGTTIFHPVGTAKMGRRRIRARSSMSGSGARPRRPARRRRFGHAAHHLGQHQFADHDDRGKGGRDDPRRRKSRLMREELLVLPPDGRQSETALMIARGVRRLLRARGFSSVTELPLIDGRRADIVAVNSDGEVLIVEIKSSLADFRADRKWRDYAARCDRLYFAISEHTPAGIMPDEAGLIVADPYGAEILREAEVSAHRRRRAAARCCCASPRPPPTGCTGSPIPGRRAKVSGNGQRSHLARAPICCGWSGLRPLRDAQCDISTGSDCWCIRSMADPAEQALRRAANGRRRRRR